jgi:hypothetical protein
MIRIICLCVSSIAFAALFGGGLSACSAASADGSFIVEERPDGYLVREDGKDVLFYQRAPKAKDGQYERSNYIHPLYGIDGEVLTEDFPADHLHQRGIYWAWHQIYVGDRRVGDSWVMEGFSWDITEVRVRERGERSVALEAQSNWISPRWTDDAGNPVPFVEETAVIRVHEARDQMRFIDVAISLRALEDNVRIGGSEDEKGYGGFSVRMRLPEGMQFTSRQGPVTPRTTALESGPWMDISGPLKQDGETSGIAILSHPANPDHPQPWILRETASMQNPVYPGREPVRLPTEAPLILRYRLVVHDGGVDQVDLNQLQEMYNQTGRPR